MSFTAPDPFALAAERLDPHPQENPWRGSLVGFAHDCIDWRDKGPTPYQNEIWAELPVRQRVAVRAPHGAGKTAIAAVAVLWFALTRDGTDWKAGTTAGRWHQLTHYLWPEIHKWSRAVRWDVLGRPALSRLELLKVNMQLATGEAFSSSPDDAPAIEGAHADSILYVFDEAKIIPTDTFDAIEGAFAGAGGDTDSEALALAISTPGEPNGRFYEIHKRSPGTEDWWTRHVTLDEAIDAGRVSAEWAEQRRRQWGEGSAVYQNRVLGEFASSDEDAIVPLAWVEAANARWLDRCHPDTLAPGVTPLVDIDAVGPMTDLGIDVARGGADSTVFAERHSDTILPLRRYPFDADTTVTAGRAEGILRAHPCRAVVDAIGVGAGVFDQLRAARLPGSHVVAFVASEGTDRKDRSGELGFSNVRSAAWWSMREQLDPAYASEVALPPDDLLTGDLTAPHWKVMAGGKIQVESKDDIRKRLGRSTDSGDAVVQAMWEAERYPAEALIPGGRTPTIRPRSPQGKGRQRLGTGGRR